MLRGWGVEDDCALMLVGLVVERLGRFFWMEYDIDGKLQALKIAL